LPLFLTLATLLLWLPFIYKYRLTNIINIKDTKLKRRGEREVIKVASGYLARAAKALMTSEPIAIFYTRHEKS
jgi:hypothetical protein